ncbi:cob(I)yrinic acid a,c-diamide adenosyltransferase [Roseibium sp.]|uniref:cob(I)yrinic acid a,c-diamide adenosyltransferase n=1 Tax=Roseibium sp. TaxID=1936156 RepID=UPI003A981C88
MVVLNKIYTRTGDQGTTALGSGERRLKSDLRIDAYGTVDETNSIVGMARLHLIEGDKLLDDVLSRIQNDLFDLGADLATPDTGEDLGYEPLRIIDAQVSALEKEIDRVNADLDPLRSFVLPGGTAASAHLHLARTVSRRAERLMVALQQEEPVSEASIKYINRLSDFFFVAARACNKRAQGDVLWVPGKNR